QQSRPPRPGLRLPVMPPSASTAACLRVALPVPLPRLFDYLPPSGETPAATDVGRRVRVPFGQRELVGGVGGAGPAEGGHGLRQALAFLDPQPLLHGELLDSLRWLGRYTHAPLGEVFATALPSVLRAGEPLPETHAWAWQLRSEERRVGKGWRRRG